MVEYNSGLNAVFASLADPTRRDILRRVAKKQLSVKDIARAYDISFAGISKHLIVLEKARLITKHRRGKEQLVTASPAAIKAADDYLQHYRELWNQRFNRLDELLKKEKSGILKNLLSPKKIKRH
jgi:DNA-binding transcriptional ArsR family regulator